MSFWNCFFLDFFSNFFFTIFFYFYCLILCCCKKNHKKYLFTVFKNSPYIYIYQSSYSNLKINIMCISRDVSESGKVKLGTYVCDVNPGRGTGTYSATDSHICSRFGPGTSSSVRHQKLTIFF